MMSWLEQHLSDRPEGEAELVERYTCRLLEVARRQLPERLRRRVDPEDVVQSVYRSFFRRLHEGRFRLDDSHDVWRLLAAMTFHKARNVVKFHQRRRRDVRREKPLGDSAGQPDGSLPAEPDSDDVATLYECLEQLLAGLPDHHREIVVRRLEGDSIEEISQQVHRSRRTVLRVLAHVQALGGRLLEESP